MPLAFQLTGGEASDSRNFELLLDIGPDILPRAAITDKGYDAKSNRDGARKRGICPVIPHRATATDRPAFFPKILYKARARIEQAVGKLKRFKRIALRCEKTARNYGSSSSRSPSASSDQIRPHGLGRRNPTVRRRAGAESGRAALRQARGNYLALIQLASIRLWLRFNQSTP